MASPAIANSISTTQTILANPIVSLASNTAYTPAQQAQAQLGAIATQAVATVLFGNLKTQLVTAGTLRYKVSTNTATASEISQYSTIKEKINSLLVQINSTGSLDADTQAALTAQLQAAKLKQIAGSPAGSVTVATFTNFLDYVFRTQAINPYSRERACDIDFIDMLSNIAGDIGESTANLQQIIKTIAASATS